MITTKIKIVFFVPLILVFLGAVKTSAQEATDHLVITQVCLDSTQSANSWIEVYNPTDGPLVLQRIRLSHLKTINVFSKSIQDQGGIQVGAGKHVILCANDSSFKSLYGTQVKTIAVTALSRLASGGFVAITTRGAREAKGAMVRYGKAEMSSNISKLAGDQVVSFSKKGKSFIREVTITKAGIGLSDFVESPAQPGKSNN
ncbi:MAG: lamin tail domain-containing protein [Bacteroidetes bacterium]|nr:lamin tail domain-containing protein [Bacteroidota bacterium]